MLNAIINMSGRTKPQFFGIFPTAHINDCFEQTSIWAVSGSHRSTAQPLILMVPRQKYCFYVEYRQNGCCNHIWCLRLSSSMYCGYWTTPLLLFVSIYDYYLGYIFYSTCKTSWKSHIIIWIFSKFIHQKLCVCPLRITFSIIKIRIAIFKETIGFQTHNSN